MRSKSLSGGSYVVPKAKKTKQGQGTHSKANHGRKQKRGQGN